MLGRIVRFTRRPALLILAFVLMAVGPMVGATSVNRGAPAAPLVAMSPQKAGIAELMKSYNRSTGLIGNSWWQAAVALSTVETYQQATGDAGYRGAIVTAFKDHKSGQFEDAFNDDTGWWGLAWLQAYAMTGFGPYLAMAETDANYIHQSWTGTCGGGVWWSTARTYKNAIANELFLELTAWLHNAVRGDSKYLNWANAEWDWFKGSGMINKSNVVNDGLNAHCANNHEKTWSYNQGVLVAGLAQLYKATKNPELLRTAEGIGKAAISHLTVGGVLREPCTGTECGNNVGGDGQSFKGIFVQDLKVLEVTARTKEFSGFFSKQARTIEGHDTDRHHQLGMFWSGPFTGRTSYSQASAEDALVAALN
jgi:predicted alpha-1,6-mannanase (GH76 family)